MKIDSSIVGTPLDGLVRDVTWRDTMNYAAAVGDLNPLYLDDTGNGVMAPPLFAVAVTWPFIETVQERLKGAVPPEILVTMVHATEHLVFHRPVRPGDRLRLSGQVAAVVPFSRSTLMVMRFDAQDSGGAAVFTEYGGAFFRGVGCADAGRGRENLPEQPRWEVSGGPAVWEASIPIPRQAAHVYDGCSGIVFPIHTSRAFARSVGLPDILLQGTATLALAAREIVDREARGDPRRLIEIACRFTDMVIPGTTVRVQALHRETSGNEKRIGFQVLNEQGQAAIREGFARLV